MHRADFRKPPVTRYRMIKLLLTSFIIYTIYKYFISPQLNPPSDSQREPQGFSDPSEAIRSQDDGEYIEYEELD